MKFFLIGSLIVLALVAVGLYAYLQSGYLSLRADQEPSAMEQKYAMEVMDASTKHYAPDLKNPVQSTDENLLEGMKIYNAKCGGCHGDPSHPESESAASFYPRAPQFLKDAPDMPENENFYIIKHGVRWTGMPAWGNRLNDDQIWKLTTFLSQMNKLPASVAEEWKKDAAASK